MWKLKNLQKTKPNYKIYSRRNQKKNYGVNANIIVVGRYPGAKCFKKVIHSDSPCLVEGKLCLIKFQLTNKCWYTTNKVVLRFYVNESTIYSQREKIEQQKYAMSRCSHFAPRFFHSSMNP